MTEDEKRLQLLVRKAEAYDLNVKLVELAEEHRRTSERLQQVNAEIVKLAEGGE